MKLGRAPAVAVAMLLCSGSVAAAREITSDDGVEVTWTMVDVTTDTQQGDAHVIEAGDEVVLIDAGTYDLARTRLIPYLRRRVIDRLDTVFVTHAHKDHYGGVRALLDAGIEIGEFEVSIPDDDVCSHEIRWGCDKADVDATLAALRRAHVPVSEPAAPRTWRLGDVGDDGDDVTLHLLERLDGNDPVVGTTDVNDTSMIMRLDVGNTSVLFTGDLNRRLGTQLAGRDLGLAGRRVLLKVPHHGADSLAPDEFFASVHPDAAFVPGPAPTWCSDRSARARTWFATHDIPTFVSGQVGDVTVHLDGDDHLSVRTERTARPC